jgi:hypothetical protein
MFLPYCQRPRFTPIQNHRQDAKLRWKEHIKKKRDELNIKFLNLATLMMRRYVPPKRRLYKTHGVTS